MRVLRLGILFFVFGCSFLQSSTSDGKDVIIKRCLDNAYAQARDHKRADFRNLRKDLKFGVAGIVGAERLRAVKKNLSAVRA